MTHKGKEKRGQGWRRALVFLMTLVLICGLAAPVYAADTTETPEQTNQELVTSGNGEEKSGEESNQTDLPAEDTPETGNTEAGQDVQTDTPESEPTQAGSAEGNEVVPPEEQPQQDEKPSEDQNIPVEEPGVQNPAPEGDPTTETENTTENSSGGKNALDLLAASDASITISQGESGRVTRDERDLSGTSVRVQKDGVVIENSGITGNKTNPNKKTTVYTISADEATPAGTYIVEFGYTLFGGWHTNYTIEVNVVALERVTITFEANGGTVDPASKRLVKDTNFTIDGLNLTVTPPDESQKFSGWRDAADNSVALSQEITATKDMTFTAQWAPRVKATFVNGEESTVRYEDNSGKIIAPEAPSASSGKLFVGWVDADGSIVKANQEISISEDKTYTAQWRDCIVITFDPQNGSEAFTRNEDENGNVVFPEAPTAPEGKQFVGWFDDQEGTGELNVPGSSDVAAKEGMVFYAKWETKYETLNKKVVSVYVAAEDQKGNAFSAEMLSLLGISYVNGSNYFPAGTVTLPDACFIGDETNLSNTDAKWDMIISGMRSGINTDVLTGNATQNRGHKLVQFADQIIRDKDGYSGSQKSVLFASTSPENITGKCDYHLDLRFSCNRIIFKTGNNGISSGDVADGSELDSRVYITGSRIQDIRGEINEPEGYKVIKEYYADANFTIPWNKIGQPLNQDEIVYVKIVELGNVKVEYKVVGNIGGTVTNSADQFNPVTGQPTPSGSTAKPDANYKFVGWYYDEACTRPIATDPHVDPKEPANGWRENGIYTYWAKFEINTTSLTVTKIVDGGLGDKNKGFNFTITYKKDGKDVTLTEVLKHGDKKTFTDIPIGSVVTIEEGDYSENGYTTSFTGVVTGDGNKATWTAEAGEANTITFTNFKDASPDTGVLLDSLPYILILAAVVLAVVLMLVLKRRRADD